MGVDLLETLKANVRRDIIQDRGEVMDPVLYSAVSGTQICGESFFPAKMEKGVHPPIPPETIRRSEHVRTQP